MREHHHSLAPLFIQYDPTGRLDDLFDLGQFHALGEGFHPVLLDDVGIHEIRTKEARFDLDRRCRSRCRSLSIRFVLIVIARTGPDVLPRVAIEPQEVMRPPQSPKQPQHSMFRSGVHGL